MPKVNLTIWTSNFSAPICDVTQSIYYCSFIAYIFDHIFTKNATSMAVMVPEKSELKWESIIWGPLGQFLWGPLGQYPVHIKLE